MISLPLLIVFTAGVLCGLAIKANRAYLQGRQDERARIDRWHARHDTPRSIP